MTSVSIKELHERTGYWLRKVSEEREVMVTERGKPVARLLPPAQAVLDNPFLHRKLLPGVARLINRKLNGPDAADIISEGREGR